jgi:tetratricopeptide (TPR) repeat protein
MVQKLPAWVQGLVDGGRLKDFEGVTKGVIEMAKKSWGDDHLNTLDAERILAEMYVSQKEYDKALGVLLPNLEKTRRKMGETHPLTTEGLILVARVNQAKKDFAALEPLLEECVRLLPGTPQTATAGYHWSWLGDIYMSRTRFQKAASCYAYAAPLLAGKEHADTLLPARLQHMRAVQNTGRSLETRDLCRQNLQLARDFLPPEDTKRWSTEYSILTTLTNTLLWRESEPEVAQLDTASQRTNLPESLQRGLRSLAQSITSRIRLREQEALKDRVAWEQAADQHGTLHSDTLAALRTWIASCGNAGGIPALDDALAALEKFSTSENALLRAEAACEAAWYRALFRGLSAEDALTIFRAHTSDLPEGKLEPGGLRLMNRLYGFARYSGRMADAAPLLDAAGDRMTGKVWPAEKVLPLVPRFAAWLHGTAESDPGTEWHTVSGFHSSGWGVKELPLGNAAKYAPASLFDSTQPFVSDRPFLLRTTFTAPDPASLSALKLRLRCADGAIVWINGKEAARRRVPEAVTFTGCASTVSTSPEPDLFSILLLEPSLLKPGLNVIAAAVYHTEKRTGPSAAFFDCALEGRVK